MGKGFGCRGEASGSAARDAARRRPGNLHSHNVVREGGPAKRDTQACIPRLTGPWNGQRGDGVVVPRSESSSTLSGVKTELSSCGQHLELHPASAGSGSSIEPATNPAPATASAKAIAKMALRMICSFKW